MHWLDLKNILSGVINYPNTHEESQMDDDEYDDARLRLAIQLSLEQNRSLTSDVIDFNIDNLYR